MKILNFKPFKSEKSSPLLGFLDIAIETKLFGWLNVYGVKMFDTGAKRWVNLPAKKADKRDDKTGKDVYFPDNKFDDRDDNDNFNSKLLYLFDTWIAEQNNIAPGGSNDVPF